MTHQQSHILTLMDELRAQGRDYCAVTVVRTANATSAKAGAKAVVTDDGVLHGFVGGGCVEGAVKRAALAVLAADQPRLIRVKPKEDVITPIDADGVELHKSGCPSGGTVDLFLEPMRQAMRLVICGASPVAASLIPIGRAMGYRITLAAAQDTHVEIPGGDDYLDGYALDRLELDGNDAVVVATQGRRDREALVAALKTPAGYVGMVGSRRKITKLREAIANDLPADRLAILHGPAGLAIGAIEPEEIALSIVSEIVSQRRSKNRATSAVDVAAV